MKNETEIKEITEQKGFWDFLKVAMEAAGPKGYKLDWGKSKNFVCPICNGKATAVRSTVNGHIHAICSDCGIALVE